MNPHAARVQATAVSTAVQTDPTDLNVASLPVRAYLDSTVVPLLVQGLSQIAKER
jgi:hypothetical protein